MSFTSEMGAADIAAVTGGNRNDAFGFGGDGGFFLLILFLFGMMGGWGNGNGYGNNAGNVASAAAIPAVQAGFDQAAVMGSLNGLTAAVNNGFAGAEISRCNTQQNLMNQLNTIAMNQQNCCCENRAATADLKYTVAIEACADRQAVSNGLRDILANNTANTQSVINALTTGFQGINDKLCQQEIDSLKTQLDAANRNSMLQQILNGGNSFARGRSPMTGRYISRDDEVGMKLNHMMNTAQSEQERMIIQRLMNELGR